MWWVASVLAVATAGPVIDDVTVEAMVDAAVPLLDDLTGTPLKQVPTGKAGQWSELGPKLVSRYAEALQVTHGMSAEDAEAVAERRVQADKAHTMAYYDAFDDRVYVLVDRIRPAFEETGLREGVLPGMVQCLVAHELAHAVHLQELGIGAMTEPTVEAYAVREGFAIVAADKVCRKLGHDVPAAVTWALTGAADPTRAGRPAGLGARYIADQPDPWTALKSPPSMAVIEAEVRKAHPPLWPNEQRLRNAMKDLAHGRNYRARARRAPPGQALALGSDGELAALRWVRSTHRLDAEFTDGAQARLQVTAFDGYHALRFADAIYNEGYRLARVGFPVPEPLPVLQRREPTIRTAFHQQHGRTLSGERRRYRSYYAATDKAVVVLQVEGPGFSHRRILKQMAALLDPA